MKVPDIAPGIEAAVQIDGVDAKEYDAPDAGDEFALHPTATRYIECADDALFTLRVDIGPEYKWKRHRGHGLNVVLRIDGQIMAARLFHESSQHIIKGHEHCDKMTGQWCLRRFQFSSVKLVEDERDGRAAKNIHAARGLGIIEVQVTRGTSGPSRSDTVHRRDARDLELTEKALKGQTISHGTTLTHRTTIKKPRISHFERLPEDSGPIATFRFLYRSRDALKRELVIPRSPSPDFARLSEAERNRLAMERFAQIRDIKVKGEGGWPIIKRELSEVVDLTLDDRAGMVKRMRPEVIDLTDD